MNFPNVFCRIPLVIRKEKPKKTTILVVEDHREVRNLIEHILTESGFVTIGVDSAENCLKRISLLKPSLILMDIELPKMTGFECCKRIRSDSQTKKIPIIFLSSHSSSDYKITGLELGGDDFLTKPFSSGELLARVKAVLRRVAPKEISEKNILKSQVLTLDMETRKAIIKKKNLSLTHKEFDLLLLLFKSKGQVLNRDILSSQIWDHENLAASRTIDIHISRLRKKLGKFKKVVQTVGTVGYRYSEE